MTSHYQWPINSNSIKKTHTHTQQTYYILHHTIRTQHEQMKWNETKRKISEKKQILVCGAWAFWREKKSPAAAYRKSLQHLTMKIIGAAFGPIKKQKKNEHELSHIIITDWTIIRRLKCAAQLLFGYIRTDWAFLNGNQHTKHGMAFTSNADSSLFSSFYFL